MAIGRYGVNDSAAVKIWGKDTAVEALKRTEIAPLIGRSPESVIHLKDETKKGPGDEVKFHLEMQLTGAGVTEGEPQEGNEEALTHYQDSLYINELMHAVRVPNDGTIDVQRVPFNLRRSARNRLSDWWAKRYSVSFFNQVAGYTAQTDTKYTGLNAVTAPSTGRHLIGETGSAAETDLDSGDTMSLRWIDILVEMAQTASVPIQPCRVSNLDRDNNETGTAGEYYVLYLHPYQVTDLRLDASTAGNWHDIQMAALQGGKMSNNGLFTGALGVYNKTIIRSAFDLPTGLNGTAPITTVRRAVFLGAQAASMAFGQKYTLQGFEWVEELFDYRREFGVSAQNILGLKKNRFNSVDYGVIVLSTYAAAHSA
jgi:N4-gp56 family major capsid protein